MVRSNLLKHFQKKIVDVSKGSAGGTYQPLSCWQQGIVELECEPDDDVQIVLRLIIKIWG